MDKLQKLDPGKPEIASAADFQELPYCKRQFTRPSGTSTISSRSRHQYLVRNPAASVPRLKVPKIPGPHLSLEEIDRLLTTAQQHQGGRFYAMVATAIYAGLRLGELLALEWSDISFTRHEIMIKEKPELGLRTKTGKFRLVPMLDRLEAILAPLRQSSGFCFFRWKALRRRTTDFDRQFDALLTVATMPRGTTWLTLRRTFGSQLAREGPRPPPRLAWISCASSTGWATPTRA